MAFQLKMIARLFDGNARYMPGQYIEDFRIIKAIGEGRYGICYLVTDDKGLYVYKQLKKGMYRKNPQKICHEEEILKALRHEAIPRFVRKAEGYGLTGYILEFKQGITLEAMIFGQGHVFTRNEIYYIGKQLINILNYLHEKGIVHRDIRISNTILDGNHVYLVDFGLARRINNEKYKEDADFACLGDLLLHLYYTSFTDKPRKGKPWYEELVLSRRESVFLKKLMGIYKGYKCINDVKVGFDEVFFS